MRYSFAVTAGVFALSSTFALAHTVEQKSALAKKALTDPDILNFALTLEHLENAFYAGGLAKFDANDFAAANSPAWVRNQVVKVAADEATHVSFLTTGLKAAGVKSVEACTYKFPYTDVKSFLAVAKILEGVGVSAYLGAASSITNPDYVTVAGSILTVEARHNAFFRGLLDESPFPAPFDTPVTPRGIVTLASPFFVSCPAGSAPALAGFPALMVKGPTEGVKLGQTLSLVLPQGVTAMRAKCTFLSGLQSVSVPFRRGKCVLPESIESGVVYVFITKNGQVTDATTIAGPAIIDVNSSAGGRPY